MQLKQQKASSIKAPDFCFFMQLKQQKHQAGAPDPVFSCN
jgi:hypothetical protein